MNYPVWEIYCAGGGFLIALIAVIHVYVAHFAVGGGLFLVLLEAKAYRDKSETILSFAKQHTKFFLLLSMVFGSLTGVGIWFIIALLSPGTTSILIHTFVFAWAAEWVCFIGEITALFIYYYKFGKMEKNAHLRIGLLYFLFAWFSLFIINGVIGFMLTPGKWLVTGNFWHGFFNPTFWSSLCFRTALAICVTGIFGLTTAVFIKDRNTQHKIVKFSVSWLLIPLIFLGLSAIWYVKSLPQVMQDMVLMQSPETMVYIKWFFIISFSLLILGLIVMIRIPGFVRKPLAFVLLLLGLFYMGSFEMVREAGRRPFLIHGHTYSNAMQMDTYDTVNSKGFLKTAKWASYKEITDDNEIKAGKDLFNMQCLPCHSVDGPMNDILPLTRSYKLFGMDAFLSGMGILNGYMPPFAGTEQERQALAKYIVEELNQNTRPETSAVPHTRDLSIPEFNNEDADYVLLAWNDLGMHFYLDCFSFFSLLPPGNNLHAQLIRRGEQPEIITQGVDIVYDIEKGFDDPSKQITFWEHSEALLGEKLRKNTGLIGNKLNGIMKKTKKDNFYRADLLPIVPYDEAGAFLPYPVVHITAKDSKTGNILAETTATLPVSTEMTCNSCHGGPFRKDHTAGISDETAIQILQTHDKNSHTSLAKQAINGKPVQCRNCHMNNMDKSGKKQNLLTISAAIHGWHAAYLSSRGPEACHQCHPSNPKGATQFFRGRHAMSFDCTDCHGFMEDHALSLLKAEKQVNKKGVDRLMSHIKPRKIKDIQTINPRNPWQNLPDCLSCHPDFSLENSDYTAFNKWTGKIQDLYKYRHDDLGALRCEACHGSPHAIFPAENNYGKARDSQQPLQYNKNKKTIGSGNCKLCHIVDMEYSGHHENQL